MLERKWTVTVGIQDETGEWWERQFDAEAPDASTALEAGREKARTSNPFAHDVRPYRAEPASTTNGTTSR